MADTTPPMCLTALNTHRGDLIATYQGHDCALPAGHGEWHRDARGFAWREVQMQEDDDEDELGPEDFLCRVCGEDHPNELRHQTRCDWHAWEAEGPALRCSLWINHSGGHRLDPCDPSRTDRQPPTSVAGAKGGLSAVAPGTTNRPDLVIHHEETT